MTDLAQRIATFLLNAAWQIPLLFAVVWLASRLANRGSRTLSHRLWVALLVGQLLIPLLSTLAPDRWGSMLRALVNPLAAGATNQASQQTTIHVTNGSIQATHWILALPPEWLLAIATTYLTVTLWFTLRILVTLGRTLRLRNKAVPLALCERQAAIYEQACAALGRWPHEQRILALDQLAGPLTMGVRAPVILVPSGLLEQLSADELQALFAHELAHIVRRDFLRNLLYHALLAPVALHPLAHRAMKQITESREILCDDLAATTGLGERRYARSLLRLATLLSQRQPATQLHAIGMLDANAFERRIMELTKSKPEGRSGLPLLRAAVLSLLATATCTAALAMHVRVSGPQPAKIDPQALAVPAGEAAGQVLSRVNPTYPDVAKAQHLGGTVVLGITIDEDGAPVEMHVQEATSPLFIPSTMEAVRQWRWKPYVVNGEPTKIQTTITVTYASEAQD